MRVVTKSDWPDLKPIGIDYTHIETDLTLNARQIQNLQRGIMPKSMTEPWFSWYEAPRLHMHNRWTGQEIFELTFKHKDIDLAIVQARFNTDPEATTLSRAQAQKALTEALLHHATQQGYEPGPKLHPRRDDSGQPVYLHRPSTASPQWTWHDSRSVAAILPEGNLPDKLIKTPFYPWSDAPTSPCGWERLASAGIFTEPEFKLPDGKKAAAGVVIIEEDGRVWAVAPSNAFGGYQATFPKGSRDPDMSLKATALREAYEETGLGVTLCAHLCDVARSTSYTRYYLARRIAGHPADMGWESQAALLIPTDLLSKVLTNANDIPLIQSVKAWAKTSLPQ